MSKTFQFMIDEFGKLKLRWMFTGKTAQWIKNKKSGTPLAFYITIEEPVDSLKKATINKITKRIQNSFPKEKKTFYVVYTRNPIRYNNRHIAINRIAINRKTFFNNKINNKILGIIRTQSTQPIYKIYPPSYVIGVNHSFKIQQNKPPNLNRRIMREVSEPGVYLFVIEQRGATYVPKYLRVENQLEICARHLLFLNPRNITFIPVAGELRINGNGTREFNIESGSITKPILNTTGVNKQVLIDFAALILHATYTRDVFINNTCPLKRQNLINSVKNRAYVRVTNPNGTPVLL